MIIKPQGDNLFWEVHWQRTTKQSMHYQADIVFLNKRLIMPGHTGLLSAHSYKQTTPTDFRQLRVTWRRNSKFFLWGALYLLLILSGSSTFQSSLLQCTCFFDLGCSLMHLQEDGYSVRSFGFWAVNWSSHRTVLLVLLAPVFPFLHTSPKVVTRLSEAPLPSAPPLVTDAFVTQAGHSLSSHLMSCSVN